MVVARSVSMEHGLKGDITRKVGHLVIVTICISITSLVNPYAAGG